jgi:hypothetical protein
MMTSHIEEQILVVKKNYNALSCSEGEPQAMSTGVHSLLDDVTVEGNPESSDDFAINNARHITYKGDDIADSFLNQFKIHSEFDRDNIKHAVTTSTKGGREFFIVTESNDLEMIWVTHRLRLPYEGPFTCIRSTCIVNTKQKCRGATIVFKLTSSNRWNFGIVSGIHYLNIHCEDLVDIYKWTGPLSCNGCPAMSLCNDQDSLMKHFTLINA